MSRFASRLPFLGALTVLLLPACRAGGARDGSAAECEASLVSGDLVVTELLLNPSGADDGREWFEIYNATGDTLDLSGVDLFGARADGSAKKLHTIDALTIESGQYVVLGNVRNEEDLLPEHVGYGYADGLGNFSNNGGQLAIGCGETIVDQVMWEPVTENAARGYDGTRTPDAMGNDDPTAWCDQNTPYGMEGQLGTPGSRNDGCFGSAPTTCEEGGQIRDVIAPTLGDLVISEFLANPEQVADADGEWFEVYVANRVDLNGLELGNKGEVVDVVGSVPCMTVEAGSFVLFARQSDPVVNGGLPDVDHLFSFALSNTDSNMFIGWGGMLLDEVTWGATGTGAASNLDPGLLDPEANDDRSSFCSATEPYGAGDLGTPGAENVQCPIEPIPGKCLEGGALVDIVAPGAGDVVITEFMANPEAVADGDGEWIELLAHAPFHLNALGLGRDGEVESTIDAAECIPVESGEFVLLAKSDDAGVNGGLPTPAATFDFALVNSSGVLFVAAGDTVLDTVTYTTTSAAAATSLDGDITDPAENDDETNWCAAVDPYGEGGDLGTPGAANPSCDGGTSDGTCLDGGRPRDIVPPVVGDLVITELMANPDAVLDQDGEWFEVLVTADVDLNGLQMGRDPARADTTLPGGGDCLQVSAGTRVVFARNADTASNGGIPAAFGTFSFSLVNTDGSVFVGLGDELLDAVTYSSTPTGASLSLDPGAEDPVANDDELNFCPATSAYGDGDLGTPGLANDSCG